MINQNVKRTKHENKISVDSLLPYLGEARVESLICLDQVDSTNTRLKELAKAGAKTGTVVIANEQTKGRGRLGRSFQSDADDGIYLSMLMRPDCAIEALPEITAWVAVCVAKAIESVIPEQVEIKWVNDILLNHKKICGILNEMSVEGAKGELKYLVCGIGVNVHNKRESFPEELQAVASSIEAETQRAVDRSQLAAQIILELDQMVSQWPAHKTEYLAFYKSRCVNLGKEVYVLRNQEKARGKVIALTDNFQLLIEYEDGTREAVSSGEVSVRGLYGYV